MPEDLEVQYRENECAMAMPMKADAVEIMESAGLESVRGFNNPVTRGTDIHLNIANGSRSVN